MSRGFILMLAVGIGIIVLAAAEDARHPSSSPSLPPSSAAPNELLFPKREGLNEAHELLMKMNEKDRSAAFTALLKASGEKCGKVTRTFYQGAASNGEVSWNVGCSNGGPLSIGIAADKRGSTQILECSVLKAFHAGDCFKAFPN